jgi:hypothetical protein
MYKRYNDAYNKTCPDEISGFEMKNAVYKGCNTKEENHKSENSQYIFKISRTYPMHWFVNSIAKPPVSECKQQTG